MPDKNKKYCCPGKKKVIFHSPCKRWKLGRLSTGRAYPVASDGKAPLKERPLPLKGGGGGGPCDIMEDRARALSFVHAPLWEHCKCDIFTTLLELCRTYSAPFEKITTSEVGLAPYPPLCRPFRTYKFAVK